MNSCSEENIFYVTAVLNEEGEAKEKQPQRVPCPKVRRTRATWSRTPSTPTTQSGWIARTEARWEMTVTKLLSNSFLDI